MGSQARQLVRELCCKTPTKQRRPLLVLLRRFICLCFAICLLTAAYCLYSVARPSSRTRGVAEGEKPPVEVSALDYLRWSTLNTSLKNGAGHSAVASALRSPTALEVRVDDVLRRRWGHTAGGVAAVARTRPVSVRVATLANRVDFAVCAEQASALASGVNVSVVGFGEPYSHVTRLRRYLDFAEKEGLADEDVVMFVDSDVLWTGIGLEDALAKFVAYSPATQASLWPAAVRAWEDFGEHIGERFLRHIRYNGSGGNSGASLLQLPPILFGAERYCSWLQMLARVPMCGMSFALVDYITELVRNGHSDLAAEKMTRFLHVRPGDAQYALESVRAFLAARRTGVRDGAPPTPRTKQDPFFYHSNALGQRNVVRFLNGGGLLMRVWALRVYAALFDEFIQTQVPKPTIGKENHGWYCDQSVHGPMYVRGRMFEAAHGLLDAPPSTEAPGEEAAGPYGVPPGMVGLDRRGEFFFTAAGVMMRHHRNYVGTEHYQRYAGHLLFRLLWYVRRLQMWWVPSPDAGAIRQGPATTASGCALTPLLMRRPPYQEDVARGYRVLRDDDADVATAPVVHIPGNDKDEKYAKILRYMPWRVAARWSRRANETLFRVLESAEVEVWGPTKRHYIPFRKMCPDVPFLT